MENTAREGQNFYYAVIFTSQRTEGDNGYGAMADQMVQLASEQPGFIGVESVRDASGSGITVSYWDSLEAIRNWKRNEAHRVAQDRGKQEWYRQYKVRICKVEREYGLE
ncbi:antibiotic biosynthesis monooxygenase [Paenibacillus nanensis]|uniref:Antibiotic biosynthesis monooxygenase n=1 Tax=Paenibacillus nanensis TaxID=393251 RepID=A0A3A1UMB1_9BACL|nr:antibiotic biosynthesis monooxygenase [Paenibacillus nanensis]RIX48599.1 antibiotic biosynthesis monooxygenase [Paenibacillus nanensis]